ncbi:MAG: ChaN family lipoprotein [Desulfobacterales bacterium]|nr:ChaN family lipoprotein [Desulfobacterales bacterium]
MLLLALAAAGCASKIEQTRIPSLSESYRPGTIVSADANGPVSFEQMIADLADARVVYVGETHTRARDHDIQLKILRALLQRHPGLCAGMEMFSRPYQQVLDKWSAGNLETDAFIRKVHWYANWKFDFGLYADLLEFIQEHRIRLYGLNIAFHVPPKVAAGGIDSLLPEDAARLPAGIDLSDSEHREYVREIFKGHHHQQRLSGRQYKFSHFYQAQVLWEEVMAETVSRMRENRLMVVFTGNGHITRDFGIPARAYRRSQARYRTVMPIAAGRQEELSAADYLWITPEADAAPHP